MFCSSCGTQLNEGTKFCGMCGTPQAETPQTGVPAPQPPRPAAAPAPASAPPAPPRQTPGDAQPRIDDMRPVLVRVEHKYVSHKRLVIKNPEKLTYLELDAEDYLFLNYLDGHHTVTQIVKEVYEQTGRMAFKRFYNLLLELYANEFLMPEGTEPLSRMAMKSASAPEAGILVRIARAIRQFEIPLEFLIFPMKAGGFIVSPFLKLPVMVAMFLLCTLPVLAASLLATKQAAALGPIRDTLHHAMVIFAPPDQKGYNIFTFHGSYLFGLGVAYASAFVTLSFRTFVRGAALLSLGCRPYRPSIKCFFGIFFIDVDGRDIVMADRTGRMAFYAAGIVSTLVIGSIINIVQHLTHFIHMLYLVYIIAYLITFLNICIFFQSDLFNLIDNFFEVPHLRKRVTAYVSQKFFQQILSFGKTFNEEKALTTIACVGLVWLYVAVDVLFAFIKDNVAILTNAFTTAPPQDKVAICVFLLNILGPFFAIMFSLFFVILRNVTKLAGGPLGRALRRMGASRGRTAADPEQIAGFISRIPLFMDLSADEQRQVAALFKRAAFKKGQNVFVQGDSGNAFYVILEGSVDVIIEDPGGLRTTIDTLGAGDSFGEIALLENVPRTATIRAAENTVLLELARPHFEKFVAQSQGAKERITETIRLTSTLRRIPFFQELAPSRMPDIISRLKKLPVKRGQAVIREGDPGDNFYIIADGSFQVLKRTQGGADAVIAKLGKNESFGEIALLNNVPRTSSVIAEADSMLLTLRREEFLSVAQANIHAGLILEEETERRLARLKQLAG